jgi:hypothetical protein
MIDVYVGTGKAGRELWSGGHYSNVPKVLYSQYYSNVCKCSYNR